MCKPKIKKMGGFVEFITGSWAMAITLAPFGIYVKEKYMPPYYNYDEIENHEKTHWAQQMEMIVTGAIISLIALICLVVFKLSLWWLIAIIAFPFLFFYLWYLIEWIIKLLPPKGAYEDLSFEREANEHEDDPTYSKNRKHFAWLKRTFNKKIAWLKRTFNIKNMRKLNTS
jgi:hypothetical protein